MAGVGKQTRDEVLASVYDRLTGLIEDDFAEFGQVLPCFTDISNLYVKGTRSLAFHCLDDYDHEEQGFGSNFVSPGPLGGPDEITCQQLNVTNEVIEIDKKCVLGISYRPCDLYQSLINWESVFQQKVIQTLILGVERSVITEALAEATAVPVTTAGTLTEGDILCAVTELHKKNIPVAGRKILLNPEDWKCVMQLSCFTKANEYGDAGALRTGQLGSVYGMPVQWSNLIPAGEILVTHPDHVRFVRGTTEILRADEPKTGCKVMSFTVPYGVKSFSKNGTKCKAIKLVK